MGPDYKPGHNLGTGLGTGLEQGVVKKQKARTRRALNSELFNGIELWYCQAHQPPQFSTGAALPIIVVFERG